MTDQESPAVTKIGLGVSGERRAGRFHFPPRGSGCLSLCYSSKYQVSQLSASPWGRALVMAAVFVGLGTVLCISSSAQWAEVELVNKDCSREGMWLTSQTLRRHRKQQLRRGPPGSASSCTAYGCDLV